MELDLFDELVATLSSDVSILSDQDSRKIFSHFESKVPIPYFRIDWKKIPKHMTAKSKLEIIPKLNELLNSALSNDQVYVLWNDASLPVLKTDLRSIINHFDDVISVGFETWLYNPDHHYVIECTNTGVATIGVI